MNATTHDDAEFELSAEELRELSIARASDGSPRADSATQGASSQSAQPPVGSPAKPVHEVSRRASATRPPLGRSATSKVAWSLGLLAVVTVAGSGLHAYLSREMPAPPREVASARAAQAQSVEAQWTEPAGEPVYFANPFDSSEVFDFPAGTTEAEAREAVAGFLMERAENRHARFEYKPKPKR